VEPGAGIKRKGLKLLVRFREEEASGWQTLAVSPRERAPGGSFPRGDTRRKGNRREANSRAQTPMKGNEFNRSWRKGTGETENNDEEAGQIKLAEKRLQKKGRENSGNLLTGVTKLERVKLLMVLENQRICIPRECSLGVRGF